MIRLMSFFCWRFRLAVGQNPMRYTMKMLRFSRIVVPLVVCSWLTTAVGEVWSGDAPMPIVDEYFFPKGDPVRVAGFRTLGGDWKVAEGVVSVGPGRGPKLVLGEPVISDGRVGVEVFFTDKRGGNVGLLVKVSDADVGADKWNGYEVSLYADKQILHLARHRQNYEPICHIPCGVPVGEWVHLSVEMTETTLKVYVQGKLIHRYEDKEHPLRSGRIAFRPWVREARYRNLWFEKDGERQEVVLAEPEETAPTVCGNWSSHVTGVAQGKFVVKLPATSGELPSQQIGFIGVSGEVCIEYEGHGGKGFPVAAGRDCRGYLWAKSSDVPADVFVALRDSDKGALAETKLTVRPGAMQQVPFSLAAKDSCSRAGFVVKLKSPGSIDIFRAYAEPADWAWSDALKREALPPDCRRYAASAQRSQCGRARPLDVSASSAGL